MTEPFDATRGDWARFDRYEIRDGLIRPGGRATLTRYDPWGAFRASRSRGGSEPPYTSLLNLMSVLKFTPTDGPGPSRYLAPRSAEDLATWCQTHGLLGILPHRVAMVSLCPVPQTVEGDADRDLYGQVQHVRSNDGWVTYERLARTSVLNADETSAGEVGEFVTNALAPADWPRPGVLIQSLDGPILRAERLSETWAIFFPDVPEEDKETYQYPAPLSDDFWNAYAEPVEEFVDAVTWLSIVVSTLTDIGPLPDLSDEKRRKVREALDILRGLTQTTSLAAIPQPDGALRQEWVSTSLLGSLATMALIDLTESKRLLTCERCGRLFVTRAYRARYCSPTCRRTVQKRRYRARRNVESDN